MTVHSDALSDLKPAYIKFVLQYINTNELTKSYMAAFPDCSYDSARANAPRLLATDSVKVYYLSKLKEMEEIGLHERKSLLKRAYTYENKADKAKKWQICCNLLDFQAKIAGHYKDNDASAGNFSLFLQQINVNNSDNNQNQPDSIDITPEKD